jgi:eukaryotic-like serine/threonine-protein kinase
LLQGKLMSDASSMRLGRYDLVEMIGKGGMGEVYRGILRGPAGFQKEVALKLLHEKASSEKARKELVAEARLGGIFRHPNLVEVLDLGLAHGRLFVVMEIVEGSTFKSLIKQQKLTPQATLDIGIQICEGLSYAHNLEVNGKWLQLVHCDLKPSNILVSNNGRVKIADFGIAHAVGYTDDIGGVRGTPSYMSPEQLKNEALSARSDIFSLGLLLFQGFTGRKLVAAKALPELVNRLRRAEELLLAPQNVARLRQIHPQLLDVLRPCLQLKPQNRYSSVSSLQKRLSSLSPLGGRGLMGVLHGSEDSEDDITVTEGFFTSERSMTRGNLPPSSELFVGREKEVDTIVALFRNSASLVTLQGPGGVGKTQLAIQAGYSLTEVFLGGIWFVDLSEASSLMDILQRTAAKIGAPIIEKEEQAAIGAFEDAISLQENNLYILDNFEQVSQYAQQTIGRWVELSSSNAFLITSQVRLGIKNEKIVGIQPLAIQDGVKFLRHRLESLGHKQEWSSSEIILLEKIVIALDGLPLALEMIASRLRVLSLEQIYHRLTTRFQLLQNSNQSNQRHASIYNAVDWSWSLLSDAERRVFNQLACFKGGFSLEDAEVVVDISDFPNAPMVMDIIERLLDRSLLYIAGEGPRFSMLRSIFAFAEKKMLEENNTELLFRHSKRFSQWADRISEFYLHGGTQLMYKAHLEMDNIRQAFSSAHSNKWLDEAAKNAFVIATMTKTYGPMDEGLKCLEMALEFEDISSFWKLKLSTLLIEFYFHLYQTNKAKSLFYGCIRDYSNVMNDEYKVRLLLLEEQFYARENNPEQSLIVAKQTLELTKKRGLRPLYPKALQQMAAKILYTGDWYPLLKEAISIFKEDGNITQLAGAWADMGKFLRIRQKIGDLQKSRECYITSQRLARNINDRSLDAHTSMSLANLEVMFGNPKGALRNYHRSYELFKRLGKTEDTCLLMGNMASCYIHLDEVPKALRMLKRCEALLKRFEDKSGLEMAKMIYTANTSIVLSIYKQYDQATIYAKHAFEATKKWNYQYLIPFVALIYIEALVGAKKIEEAKVLLPNVVDIEISSLEPHGQVRLLLQQGLAQALLHNKKRALELSLQIEALISKHQVKDLEVQYEFRKLTSLLSE